MKPWTAAEEDAALAVMRMGGSVEDIAEALPHRTARAIGIKANRLQRVVDREAKARRDRPDSEIVSEWDRLRGDRNGRDVVTNETFQTLAPQIGVPEDRLRETMLRHWGVLE